MDRDAASSALHTSAPDCRSTTTAIITKYLALKHPGFACGDQEHVAQGEGSSQANVVDAMVTSALDTTARGLVGQGFVHSWRRLGWPGTSRSGCLSAQIRQPYFRMTFFGLADFCDRLAQTLLAAGAYRQVVLTLDLAFLMGLRWIPSSMTHTVGKALVERPDLRDEMAGKWAR